MKRYFAILVLVGSIVSATSLFAQQRSGGPPSPTAAPAPGLSIAQSEETVKQLQDMLQRLRTPNMPETDRVNMLREMERALAQIQRSQENAPRLRIVAPAGVNGVQLPVITTDGIIVSSDGLVARRVTRADGSTNAWWTNANFVSRIGLTDDQKTRIERAFEASKQNLTTSRDQLEKEERQLERLLAADTLDRGGITTQINRVVQARGELERVNSLMTLEMRSVLTGAQWGQVQAQTSNSGGVYFVNSVAPAAAPVAPGSIGLRGGGRGGAPTPAPVQPGARQ